MHDPGDRRICAITIDGSIRYAFRDVRLFNGKRKRPHIANHLPRQCNLGLERVADWTVEHNDGSELDRPEQHHEQIQIEAPQRKFQRHIQYNRNGYDGHWKQFDFAVIYLSVVRFQLRLLRLRFIDQRLSNGLRFKYNQPQFHYHAFYNSGIHDTVNNHSVDYDSRHHYPAALTS